MFDKILIANRGEIACRIIRTAKKMGVLTVAVYSDADISSMHVELAGEAYHIGPAPARESYLKQDKLLGIARKSGVKAVHPGYGFMSENPDFADACKDAGIIFIGPPADAIRSMGSKSAAKKIMENAGVPLVPGYHGEEQGTDLLRDEAEKIGYPLMIKAVMGGGGKGMRIVREAGEFIEALTAAGREAEASFGDKRVLLERYISKPRHVEIQIFADNHGNVVHLFERDCSIQRRHQKIIEEAPAPGMNEKLREKMGKAAVAAAKAIGYTGAGTVEFLLDGDGNFYFMEMNTRLQVEHPITEMITGVDLVEWQLRVAGGESLPLKQEDLSINGHAIEARIYAEDPSNNFLPSIGQIHYLSTPEKNENVRIDTGIRKGDEVSMEYDPMIAKLIVWDVDRDSSIRRLTQALAKYHTVGVITNVDFLRMVSRHKNFVKACYDTEFIELYESDLFPAHTPAQDRVLALAALFILLNTSSEEQQRGTGSLDPHSPWNMSNGWRVNTGNHHEVSFIDGDKEVNIKIHYCDDGYILALPSGEMKVSGNLGSDGSLSAQLGGSFIRGRVISYGLEMTILTFGSSHRLVHVDPYAQFEEQDDSGGSLTAPMPGRIIEVLVKEGSRVKKGDPLLTMEAMKMEHTINAPGDGTVIELKYTVGDQVNDGEKLLLFEAADKQI